MLIYVVFTLFARFPFWFSNRPLVASGVTFPSGDMQQTLVRSLYNEANVSPEQVEYIEAHGTGTKVNTQLVVS